MSASNSESESQRSGEEDERTENGHSHEENGHSYEENENVNENGASTWRAGKAPLTPAFPISRVRRLVKSGGDVQWVGVEAGFLIAKAAEVFLEKMVEDAFDKMLEKRQHSILYPHLCTNVASSERLEFLSDFVPIKIPGETALANIKMANQ
ncbi:hypothetical protein M758_10G007600 [Ceratodon purpureus]|nr:hypothetical protein M758_10G007600 [Ceratodon purpureus]